MSLYHEVTEPERIAEQRRLNHKLQHLENALVKGKKIALSNKDSLRRGPHMDRLLNRYRLGPPVVIES